MAEARTLDHLSVGRLCVGGDVRQLNCIWAILRALQVVIFSGDYHFVDNPLRLSALREASSVLVTHAKKVIFDGC